MNKNRIVAGLLLAGALGAGWYFYSKSKAKTAPNANPATASGANSALINAGATVATSELNNFTSWLTSPGSNTNSTNSTSGTPDNTSYEDTGLDDLYGG